MLPQGGYVFGGGSLREFDHILRVDPATASVSAAGRLPSPSSDVAVTQAGATAYIVGGYNGSNFLTTVLAYTPGRSARVVGHLPVALRYAAATPGPIGQILVIGGTTPTGASRAVYIFNPATGHTRRLAQLPGRSLTPVRSRSAHMPIWSAAAATRPRVRPRPSGRSTPRPAGFGVGAPAWPTSDAAVLRVGSAIIIAGGMTPTGTTLAEVGGLVPAP